MLVEAVDEELYSGADRVLYADDTSMPELLPPREERGPHIKLTTSCVKAARPVAMMFGISMDKLCGLDFDSPVPVCFRDRQTVCWEKNSRYSGCVKETDTAHEPSSLVE
jgi:hypothetical protein